MQGKLTRLLIFTIFIWPCIIGAQNLLPPIYNYRVFEYNAAGQNWGLSVSEKGELFSANDKGLLYFNGEEWVLNKLPNSTIIRSVYADGQRIYTGSYEEFGYWEKDETGLLNYTSLTHLIQDHTFTNEEFWQIIPFENKIVFRSFSTIYIYEDDQITIFNPEQVITNIAVQNNQLIVASKSNGLFELQDNKMVSLPSFDEFQNATIISIESFKNGLLIGTQLKGCFVYQDGNYVGFDKEINELLKRDQLNKILSVSKNEIAFGTIKNGIYLYNTSTKSIKNLNRGTGLQNNTVLSMARFHNQFWAGLENGLDRIGVNSPITYYTDYSGILGTTHDIAQNESTTYLGSNTGIYLLNKESLSFVEGSQGHVWDLETIENNILAGHNTATFKIEGNNINRVSSISGGYEFAKVPESNNTYLQGTYTGVAKFVKSDNQWSVSEISGISFPVKQLCFEDAHTLWVAHSYKGLYRFKLDENLEKVIESKEFGPSDIPNNYQVKLYQIKNQIILQSDGQWFKYDPIVGEIDAFEEFVSYSGKSLIYADGDNFWFIDNKPDKELVYTDLKGKTIYIAKSQLNERLVPDMERIIKQTDSTYLLTLSDGFAKINLTQLEKSLTNAITETPELTHFQDTEKRYSVTDTIFDVPNRHANDITLQVASPSLVNPRYYYELSGEVTRSSYSEDGELTFQNLPHGLYELKVSTVSMDNKKSRPKILAFEIAPPWYLTKWSLLFYLLLLISTIFIVRWYNRRKLKRKHEALKVKLQHEQDERVAQLEKEKLEKEIKGKQNELARTTMSVAKKNELILELKDLMVLNKDAFSNKQRYRSLTKKLDSSINEDEDWKQFEVNFKELHNDFFENLLRQYPRLTPKDLKLCAYLKMNLSTKEIAPLMAITVRGVEIHRYRLRKKLGIDSSQNLSNFLIKFK
ncbi:Two component regulator three Y domain-containing protein [Euzebyella marina]|uniref:Two component regulator three Y domain-containing protein n=1 Tax=Euzebyella marina TaxID=1761453 RepID=A0A3G2L2D1_9FLAO|nr:Two component regulator three Y domain-containing protein [Euzebyella marina]AYN66410.1 Two component regulator three Y domain-containing protein [Euzebyella marina]